MKGTWRDLFKFFSSMYGSQMYSAQTMKNKFNMLAGIMGEEEDDQAGEIF